MKQSRTIEEIERKYKFMSCSKYCNTGIVKTVSRNVYSLFPFLPILY